jgi:hypothetical protein
VETVLTPEEARAIARQAYVYGFPLVENYGLMYGQAVAEGPGSFGFNRMMSSVKLYGPEDQEVVTPNNDTPYSMAWLDLGGGPVILTIDGIEPETRYWSFQVIDAFTNNIEYIGLRGTGPNPSGQSFWFYGPDTPEPPGAVNKVPCPGRFVFLIGRTQLYGAADIPNVEAIQAGYKIQPTATPPPASLVPYEKPADPDAIELSFFSYLNQVFVYQAPPADNDALMAEFAKIGVGPGQTFDPDSFSPEVQEAMLQGMREGRDEIIEKARTIGLLHDGWNLPNVNAEYFGTTPEDDLFRAAIGYKGIYANSPIEAIYPMADLDGENRQLSGADQQAYTIHFAGDNLPPAQYFWSLTMYYARTKFLVPNSIDRYSISNQTDGVQSGEGGSLTFHVQADEPAAGVSNWLPAPPEPFYVVLRIYGPKPEVFDGTEFGSYRVPPLSLN